MVIGMRSRWHVRKGIIVTNEFSNSIVKINLIQIRWKEEKEANVVFQKDCAEHIQITQF